MVVGCAYACTCVCGCGCVHECAHVCVVVGCVCTCVCAVWVWMRVAMGVWGCARYYMVVGYVHVCMWVWVCTCVCGCEVYVGVCKCECVCEGCLPCCFCSFNFTDFLFLPFPPPSVCSLSVHLVFRRFLNLVLVAQIIHLRLLFCMKNVVGSNVRAAPSKFS